MDKIHIIGGGLSGLSAAIAATAQGHAVSLHESTAKAGGRCRSYHDSELDLYIDNGNHLLLTGNKAAFAYLDAIGGTGHMTGPARPIFPFIDLKKSRTWTLRPSPGLIPWWLFFPERRVPRTTFRQHLALLSVGKEWDDTVVAETMPHAPLYWLLLEPLAIAALNTRPHEGLACLLRSVLRETLLKGGKACLPRVPKVGLSDAFVDPALDTLRRRGAEVRLRHRITGLDVTDNRVTAIRSADGPITVGPNDGVILAVPPWVAKEMLPDLTVPDAFESILNLHYKIDVTPTGDVATAGFIGVIRGVAEWIFIKPGHVSVTISAANKWIDMPAVDLAVMVWRDVVAALKLPPSQAAEVPKFRVIKERRATIVANAAQEELRPAPRTDLLNLTLAGDWTDTRLPATIEGAIRSGASAVRTLIRPETKPERDKRKLARHHG